MQPSSCGMQVSRRWMYATREPLAETTPSSAAWANVVVTEPVAGSSATAEGDPAE